MRRRLKNAWFLSVLVLVLAVGIWQSPALQGLADAFPRTALIAAIMFVTALPIDLASFHKARHAWPAVGLAVALTTIAAPLLGWLASFATPDKFAIGLLVAAASPCTLASGVVWTRRGGGNDGVTVLVTLITNLGSFLVMPFWIGLLAGATLEGGMPNLGPKLLVCVAAPIVAAQLLRRSASLTNLATAYKPALSVAAQVGVLTMALLGAIEAGESLRLLSSKISTTDWIVVALATALVHTALLAAGWWLCKAVRIARAEAIAVALAGSQKTLAVGIGIALEFGGLAIFPMIAYHIQQLVIDTLFVDHVRQRPAEAGSSEESTDDPDEDELDPQS